MKTSDRHHDRKVLPSSKVHSVSCTVTGYFPPTFCSPTLSYWLDLLSQRHPRLAGRSSRIYETNRVVPDEDRMREFYAAWHDFVEEDKPEYDRAWNSDEKMITMSPVHLFLVQIATILIRLRLKQNPGKGARRNTKFK